MTTFEIIMIILAVLAVLLIGMLIKRITYVGHILLETIGDIASNNAERISTTNGHLFDISQQLNHIEDDIIEGLHDIRLGDKICDRSKYYMGADGHNKNDYECFKSDSPVTAAYEMVCWLLEQGLIKKGDDDE